MLSLRLPKSLFYVILDILEKLYLAGFLLLQLFVSFYPMITAYTQRCEPSSAIPCDPSSLAKMEFLPLMATSVYCAVGLVWGFLRLVYIYLHEESTYQSQLSKI